MGVFPELMIMDDDVVGLQILGSGMLIFKQTDINDINQKKDIYIQIHRHWAIVDLKYFVSIFKLLYKQ